MGIMETQGCKTQVMSLNCQRQGGCGYQNEQWSQRSNLNSLTLRDPRHRQVEHGFPKSEIDGQDTIITSPV